MPFYGAGNMGEKCYRGIIFDLDGTLIRSSIDFMLMRERVMAVLKGQDLPPELLDPKGSMSYNVLIALGHLERRLDQQGLKDLLHNIEEASTEVEMMGVERTQAFPGVKEMLASLREDGYLLGLLTRGSRRYAERALEVAGLTGVFPVVVCRDDNDLREAKPNPVALVRTAGLMGLAPKECVFVGDHHIDQDCADGAGAFFVGVLSGSNDLERWSSKRPSLLLHSVADLPSALPACRGKIY